MLDDEAVSFYTDHKLSRGNILRECNLRICRSTDIYFIIKKEQP